MNDGSSLNCGEPLNITNMKKLFILIVLLAVGCSPLVERAPSESTSIPVEVMKTLKTDTVPGVLYAYQYDSHDYYFDKNKNFVVKYNCNYDFEVIKTIIIVIIIALIIGKVIGLQINKRHESNSNKTSE